MMLSISKVGCEFWLQFAPHHLQVYRGVYKRVWCTEEFIYIGVPMRLGMRLSPFIGLPIIKNGFDFIRFRQLVNIFKIFLGNIKWFGS